MAPTPDRAPRFPAGFWPVWSVVALDLLGFGIIIPLLPLYAERFGASPFLVGLLLATYSLGQFVMSPVWGRISDRVGRKPILVVTVAGSAIGSLVLGLAGTLPVLFLGRAIDGVSGASVAVARATVADTADAEQRPRLMGLLGAAFGFGFVVGPAIGSLAARFGPSVPFFLATGLAILNLVSILVRVPETRVRMASAAERLGGGLARVPGVVRRLVLVTFVGVAAFGVFEATFSLLADRRLGLDESQVGFVFAGVGVLLVLTQGGLVGPAVTRLGEAVLLRVGLGLNVAGFVMLATGRGWALLIPGLAVLALGQGLITPTLSSAVAGSASLDWAGATLGLQESAGGLARVAGPALGGALFGVAVALPYWVGAVLTLAVVPLVPRLISGRR